MSEALSHLYFFSYSEIILLFAWLGSIMLYIICCISVLHHLLQPYLIIFLQVFLHIFSLLGYLLRVNRTTCLFYNCVPDTWHIVDNTHLLYKSVLSKEMHRVTRSQKNVKAYSQVGYKLSCKRTHWKKKLNIHICAAFQLWFNVCKLRLEKCGKILVI